MKQIGIWMDKQQAHVVRLHDAGETLETIHSNVEFFNLKGSSGSRVKWGGTQDISHESTYLEKEKHQLKAYFNQLAGAIMDADAIAVFGPSDTNEKFKAALMADHKALAAKLKNVEKADSMTENQVKALIRDYFRDKK